MTTTLKDTSIEVAGRRLNPQVLPEWQLLLTHIEISEGFSFVVLLVPDADWADACRFALSHSLDALDKSLLTVALSSPEDFKVELPGRLLNLNISDRIGAVWLEKTVSEASPQFPEWQDAWHGMVARLNQFRNPLRRHFQVPLVFVGASWIQPLIREAAPDLWSVRTLVTRIQPQSEPAQVGSQTGVLTTEQEHVGLAIDPDFALKAAERLRGCRGKELAMANLLYRAGLGLNARSRWSEGESVLREALDLERQHRASEEKLANTLVALSNNLRWQSKFPEARVLLQDLRAYYQSTSDVKGEAGCMWWLAEIASSQSDNAVAQDRYEEALSLFRQVGFTEGEAYSIQRLGLLAIRRSESAKAKAYFEEALVLFQRIGNTLGEAVCLESLGDLARRNSDHATAQAHYEEALSLCRRTGSVLGEAVCIVGLGDLAESNSDYETARSRYEEALPLFRRVGSMLGVGNCIQSLGDIYRLRGARLDAREKYFEALQIFERIGEPFSIGWTHLRLARVEDHPRALADHLEAAKVAWMQIGRQDLIAQLDREFNITETNNATHR